MAMKKLCLLVLTFVIGSISYADNGPTITPNLYDPSGFYLGLNLGLAQANLDNIAGWQQKNSGLAGRVYFGYDINRYAALDIGYILFPQVRYTHPVIPDTKINNNGFDLLITGKYPIGEGFSLYGQLGGVMLRAKLTSDNQAGQTANATVLAYGAGIDYVFAPIGGLHAILGWYHTDNKNGSPFNIPTENLYALGAYYQF
jgi:hypothetical protein